MDSLDAANILVPGTDVRVLAECGSTNTLLMRAPDLHSPALLVADVQTAGRGRRGRRWYSAPGAGITFSLARRIGRPSRELASLSLVAGVAAVRALRALGAGEVSLKWPNDLLATGRKLGGILVESRAQAGRSLAVIGVGINYRQDEALGRRLRRPVACLQELLPLLPSRNRVIQQIARALVLALDAFEIDGLESVRDEWIALHVHAGQRVRVRLADGRVLTGIAAGLAEDGGLRLRTRSGMRAVRSGRVLSARAA
jgi:BirA family transcriptional regulator, biotin operon repressor / biotin---[acetyl-CoA-carboxylase] ligase